MGSIFAHDLAATARGNASPEIDALRLRVAIEQHFQYNHYPPLPHELVDTALAIIERYPDDTESPVALPGNVTYKGQSEAPYWECVKAWHLDYFLSD